MVQATTPKLFINEIRKIQLLVAINQKYFCSNLQAVALQCLLSMYSSLYILSLDKGNEKFQGIVNFTFRTANIPQENYAEFINQLLPLLFLFKKYFFLCVFFLPWPLDSGPLSVALKQ